MKKFVMLVLVLCLLLTMVSVQAESVIDLVKDPQAAYQFEEGAEILEVIYPRIYGSDCTIFRLGETVILMDASDTLQARERILPALEALGIDHIDLAIGTHPHMDHISGLITLAENGIELDEILLAMREPQEPCEKLFLKDCERLGLKVTDGENGQVIRLGPVTITLSCMEGKFSGLNDRSAIAMVRYGERKLLSLADIEIDAQKALEQAWTEEELKADILKFPHHGQVAMVRSVLEKIQPEMSVLTALELSDAKPGYQQVTRKGWGAVSTPRGPFRFRTDGHIWVLDQYPAREQ